MEDKAVGHSKRVSRRSVLGGLTAAGGGLLGTDTTETARRQFVKRWDEEFDVIVVGFGVAGACATHEALRTGAKVLVIDRGAAAANASHGTKIYMGGGTALQRAYKVHDTPEQMMKYLLSATGREPDQERVRAYVEHSVANFDWLVELGVPFSFEPAGGSLEYSGCEQDYPWRETDQPIPRGHIPKVSGADGGVRGGGAWIQQRLLAAARDSGATLLLDGEARWIVRGEDGVVEGLVAKIGERDRRFRALKGLVVATGGFANNREMVAQHAPTYLDCPPVDLGWNEGWGIRAGQAVGAAVRRMGAADVTWLLYPPASRKHGILVNARGQRFIAEDSYSGRIGDAIVREQQGVAYLIVDSITMADGPSRIHDIVDAQASSIEELERALAMPAPVLQQAVGTYNQYASVGQDPLLHKAKTNLRPITKPPFTAINASLNHTFLPFFTIGGLHTTPMGEVLNTEGNPIPQFYAVGRASSGIPSPYYYASGLSLGECVTFGRIAGMHAATKRLA